MSIVVCVELLLMYQIPHGEVHILHIYICVHTPHVRDTGRSPHGAGPGATENINGRGLLGSAIREGYRM